MIASLAFRASRDVELGVARGQRPGVLLQCAVVLPGRAVLLLERGALLLKCGEPRKDLAVGTRRRARANRIFLFLLCKASACAWLIC